MTTEVATQQAILADALTEIVDLATGSEKKVLAPPGGEHDKVWGGQPRCEPLAR
jgi:hypothetical protein